MRRPSSYDWLVQALLAGLCLTLLAWGFVGEGSFQDVFGTLPEEGPAWGQKKRELLLAALGQSGWIGLGAAAVALGIGVPAAWALASRRRSLLMLALCALPLALAPSVAVSGWLRWMAPAGVSSSFGRTAPATVGPGDFFCWPSVALILGLGLWPLVAFEAWPAFVRARGAAYESALLAGSPVRAFLRVVVPLSAGELAAGASLVFLLAAGDFTVSSLLLVRTLPILVYEKLQLNQAASAAWTALPLVLLAALTVLLMAGLRRRGILGGGTGKPPREEDRPAEPSGWHRSAGCDAVLVLGIFAGFLWPVAGCFTGAFAGKRPLAEVFGAGLPALVVSLRLAGAAAMAALVLGALRVACWPETPAAPLRGVALLLLAVPGSFLAAGLLDADLERMGFFEQLGEPGAWLNRMAPGGFLLTLGYVLRFLYLPLRLAEEGLQTLDPSLLDAAELAGHTRLARGLGVALPLMWPHLLAAGALVFVLALGELPVSDKLAPPGAMPITVWLFDQQHYGYSESVFALSLLLGGAAAGGLLGAGALGMWLRARARWKDAV